MEKFIVPLTAFMGFMVIAAGATLVIALLAALGGYVAGWGVSILLPSGWFSPPVGVVRPRRHCRHATAPGRMPRFRRGLLSWQRRRIAQVTTFSAVPFEQPQHRTHGVEYDMQNQHTPRYPHSVPRRFLD